MDGSTLRNELREFVAACDAAFWLAKFVVAAGGDWPRLPFCCRGIVSATRSFFTPYNRLAWRCLCVSGIFAARASEEAPKAACARGVLWRDVAWLGVECVALNAAAELLAFSNASAMQIWASRGPKTRFRGRPES